VKIAVWHNLPSGGGKRALYDHVKGLVARGHTLEAWCPPTADQSYLPLNELITEHVVPLSYSPRTTKNRASEIAALYRDVADKIAAMDEHCRLCAEEINRGGFDLLFANSCWIQAVTSIGHSVNIPKILYLQEPFRMLYEANPELPWIAAPKVKNIWQPGNLKRFPRDLMQLQGLRVRAREEARNAKAFDAILVNSLFSRESLLRAYGVNAKVCYLGIDTHKFVNRHLGREPFVVGVGSLMRHKNIRFVVEALAQVSMVKPRLVWVGNASDPAYVKELTELARSAGVVFEPKVRIDDTEIVELLNRALMMLYAPRLEPFGYAPLEANACGAPVVAVAEGGVRETIVNDVNGLLVESEPQAMTVAIETLMNDEAYARRLGETGCELVNKQWSLDAAIDRIEQRFAEVVALKALP